MSFKNKKIVYFGELQFSASDLETIGREVLALVATLSYIANEISTFQRLFIQSTAVSPCDEVVQTCSSIQTNVLLRTLSAKLFETIEQLPRYRRTLERKELTASLHFLQDMEEKFLSLKMNQTGYEIAKHMRDKITNHYLPSVVLENLEEDEAPKSAMMLHHEKIGNSFHQIGDEYVFYTALRSAARENKCDENEALQAWLEWCTLSMRAISTSFEALLISIVNEKLPHLQLTRKTPYVELELAGNIQKTPLPLFHLPD